MTTIVNKDTFDYAWFRRIKWATRPVGNPGGSRTVYKDIITAFDIECSTIDTPSGKQAFMYIWQWQIGTEYTVIGRTWEEFDEFRRKLTRGFGRDNAVWVAVHNLSYEFQFLRGVYRFKPEDVFVMKSRKILSARLPNVEFHCSYLHSAMSLKQFLKTMRTEHQKIDGYDYDKVRFPWTPISDDELAYAVNDVLGLVEALQIQMEAEHDTLYTFPQTSTGYVRRKAKLAMRKVNHNYVKNWLNRMETYILLREAFRGGNTHANRWYAGRVLHNVKSADRASSYPDVMVNCEFPKADFDRIEDCKTMDDLRTMVYDRGKAAVFRLRMWDVRLQDNFTPVPYLAKDKCRFIRDDAHTPNIYDNGRIIRAAYCETTMTDVDLRILLTQYEFDHIEPFDVYTSSYQRLPQPFVDLVNRLFHAKTSLKGVEGREIEYALSKAQINALYGMSCQDPVKDTIEYLEDEDTLYVERGTDKGTLLDKHNRKAFLPYSVGVWVTAHARAALQAGIDLAGDQCVYVDTDSVKYVGEVDFSEFNAAARESSRAHGGFADDPKGTTHYLGEFEQDGDYYEFATLGAKKYAYREKPGGKMKATIAGVAKNDVFDDSGRLVRRGGGSEMDLHGGFDAFLTDGFVFREAGGSELIYNDSPDITEIEIDDHILPITSNVVIQPSTYTLGITAEYRELLCNIAETEVDIFNRIEV